MNIVGLKNQFNFQPKRLFTSSFISKNNIISILFKNRLAPIKLFDSSIIDICTNLISSEDKKLFFNKFKDKGGIYLIKYIDDESIYYIGRAIKFKKRLDSHLKTKATDKFHLFANLVGWDKFQFSIIEICNIDTQKKREDFYLEKYLPILNTVFKSNFSESQIYDNLYNQLKLKQLSSQAWEGDKLELDNKY